MSNASTFQQSAICQRKVVDAFISSKWFLPDGWRFLLKIGHCITQTDTDDMFLNYPPTSSPVPWNNYKTCAIMQIVVPVQSSCRYSRKPHSALYNALNWIFAPMDLAPKQLLIPQRIYLDSALSSFYYVTHVHLASLLSGGCRYTQELLTFFLYFSLSKQYCKLQPQHFWQEKLS